MPFPSRPAARRQVRLHRGPTRGRPPNWTLPAFPTRAMATACLGDFEPCRSTFLDTGFALEVSWPGTENRHRKEDFGTLALRGQEYYQAMANAKTAIQRECPCRAPIIVWAPILE